MNRVYACRCVHTLASIVVKPYDVLITILRNGTGMIRRMFLQLLVLCNIYLLLLKRQGIQ